MNSQGVVDGEVVFLEAKRKQMRKDIVLVINHGHTRKKKKPFAA